MHKQMDKTSDKVPYILYLSGVRRNSNNGQNGYGQMCYCLCSFSLCYETHLNAILDAQFDIITQVGAVW